MRRAMQGANGGVDAGYPHAQLCDVPGWLDGESLYGWCSRYLDRWIGTTKDLGAVLFGRDHACRQREFPHGMRRFQHATRSQLGSIEHILRQRTVLGAYWPLIGQSMRKSVVAAASDTTGVAVAMALGLPANRINTSHPLRWCTECLAEGHAQMEQPTWRIEHQWPGAWACARHRRPLLHANSGRAQWLRPGRVDFSELQVQSEAELDALCLASTMAARLAQHDEVDQSSLQINCIERLRALGVAVSRSRLSAERLDEWFAATPIGRCCARNVDLIGMPGGQWIRRLLRDRVVANPTKWVVLWTALWGDIATDSALAAFDQACKGRLATGDGAQHEIWPDGMEHSWASWPPPRVCDAFDRLDTIKGVAEELDISIRAVKGWLADFPEFRERWTSSVRQRRTELARSRIDEYMRRNPGATRAAMLRHCGTDMSWLSRWNRFTWQRMLDRVPHTREKQFCLFD